MKHFFISCLHLYSINFKNSYHFLYLNPQKQITFITFFVNLKKKNTSKIQFVSKRLATVSLLCLAFTAVIVVPLTNKVQQTQAAYQRQINEIIDENLGNDYMQVNNVEEIMEINL